MARLRTEAPNPSDAANGSKRKKPRVSIYKNEDGSYDYSSLSDEDRAFFTGGGSGPAPAAAPPANDPPPAPAAQFNPALTGVMLNLLVSIEATVVGTKFNLPVDRVQAALEPKPPFDVMITDAATAVLNKYAVSMGPYQDELALAAMIVTWQVTAFQQIRYMVAEQAANAPQAAPPNVDHDKHQSPPPAPAAAPPKPAGNVVPIDLLIGAHGATSASAGV